MLLWVTALDIEIEINVNSFFFHMYNTLSSETWVQYVLHVKVLVLRGDNHSVSIEFWNFDFTVSFFYVTLHKVRYGNMYVCTIMTLVQSIVY